jgi:hypothetical protein
MMERYDIRRNSVGPGWTVLDTQTGLAASLYNFQQSGLSYMAAEDAVDELSLRDLRQRITERQSAKRHVGPIIKP